MKGNVGKCTPAVGNGNPFADEEPTDVDADCQVVDPPLRTRALTLPYGARFVRQRISVVVGALARPEGA